MSRRTSLAHEWPSDGRRAAEREGKEGKDDGKVLAMEEEEERWTERRKKKRRTVVVSGEEGRLGDGDRGRRIRVRIGEKKREG